MSRPAGPDIPPHSDRLPPSSWIKSRILQSRLAVLHVKEDSNLSSDLAMDPFDLLEVLMEIEEKIGIRISDDVFGDKPVDELTVGIFADMLYVYFKDK